MSNLTILFLMTKCNLGRIHYILGTSENDPCCAYFMVLNRKFKAATFGGC